PYLRAWQIGFAAYALYFALSGYVMFGNGGWASWLGAKLLLCVFALTLLASTRHLQGETFHFHWQDAAFGVISLLVIGESLLARFHAGRFVADRRGYVEVEVWI